MFLGKHLLQVRETNEVPLPINFLAALKDGAYLTRGFEQDVLLFSKASFAQVCDQLRSISISEPAARLLNRLLLGNAVQLNLEPSGSLHLPQDLCDYAAIQQDVVLIGQGDYAEFWTPSLWEKQLVSINDYQANTHRFEKIHLTMSSNHE